MVPLYDYAIRDNLNSVNLKCQVVEIWGQYSILQLRVLNFQSMLGHTVDVLSTSCVPNKDTFEGISS